MSALQLMYWRFAASGCVPARWYNQAMPAPAQRAARRGRLRLEIVSHCWQYAHLLAYQLSSLVRYPPQRVDVTMHVCHAKEDLETAALLRFFGAIDVPGVRWQWHTLPRERLFRRAIGRNAAALASDADWVWFTDCDLMFRGQCLDVLGDLLQGRRDALVYPRCEYVTDLLADDDPLLLSRAPAIVDIDDGSGFRVREPGRATGPLQITHGDVARALGYCKPIRYYQQPARHWRKAYEDCAHRWLLESRGAPLDVPGVYRIRHVAKGRYGEDTVLSQVRTGLRRQQDLRR